uniref:E3 ubiquitin/ISG15 ligase TRIM25-like n=1 Tax=Petromyzon marinus TaxID=7757 RepID=A0AAJ7XJ71_PETMA|nr:E3 ubiquitin/ISG15 ligase TRIM25-like [Petromyzon marinus]
MASAAPTENVDRELTCSICLDTFDCPSTLSCGHSFCLQCLEDAWKETDFYCCPQCRKTFPLRPQLTRNVTIANLIDQLRVTETMVAAAAGGVVFCDNCPKGKTPAVKTCLKCDTSFCRMHLAPHLEKTKFNDHVLVSPDVNPEERKCKRHKQELIFYCKQDLSLVCTVCAFTGEHKGHYVDTLENEHKTRKGRVGEEMRAVEDDRKKAVASVGRMKATRKAVQVPRVASVVFETFPGEFQGKTTKEHPYQESVAGIRGRITGKFAHLKKALDEDEKEALRHVAMKERELLSRIDEGIARHKREISELQVVAARLHALQHERDSLAFLQGHLEETRRHVLCMLWLLSVPMLWLNEAVCDVVGGCPRRKFPKESAPPPATSLDATTIRSLERVVNRFLPLVYGRSPTLDTNSAHDLLQISSDLRTATRSDVPQGRPHHPHRFECHPQALCSESFSSGQHYWEVDVGCARRCRVSVVYGSIPRRGRGAECALGLNDVSWCLQKVDDSFSVLHGGVVTSLSVPQLPRRVGVHLDWDAGLLSFYSADSMAPLYSFHQTFIQPLHPGLGVWNVGDSVRIVDLSGAS